MEHITWNFDPILINFGFLKIRWYGLMFACAFMFCYSVMQWIYQRENKNIEDLDRLLWYMVIGTILGARLGHTLLYDPGYYLSHPGKMLAVWEGGLASHGAVIGIVLTLFLYKLKSGDDYLWLLDRIIIPIPVAGALIRVGNFFNSEILGLPSDLPWAMIFSRIDSVPRHPVQLYEAASYAAFFFLLLAIYKRVGHLPYRGLLFGIFACLMFPARFIMEFFKTEQAMYDNALPFTTGQLLSIPFFLLGIGFIVVSLRRYRSQHTN